MFLFPIGDASAFSPFQINYNFTDETQVESYQPLDKDLRTCAQPVPGEIIVLTRLGTVRCNQICWKAISWSKTGLLWVHMNHIKSAATHFLDMLGQIKWQDSQID